MKTFIITIKDTLSNTWHQPTQVLNQAHATRAFGQQCQDKSDPRNEVARAPGDYELWLIGEYDDDTGTGEWYKGKERKRLATGKSFVTSN